MKILYLSFYFSPDLCAGSFRNTPLVSEISKQLNANDKIHVITTMPNRYKSFSENATLHESIGNVEVNRIDLPPHRSGFFDQAFAFQRYFRETLKLTKSNEYDIVFASSSRLFTAFLGSIISRRKTIPLYLDIRDIFVDTLQDVINNRFLKGPLLNFMKLIERYTLNQGTHINLISEGFRPYFEKIQQASFSFFSNGIDPEFLSISASESKPEGEYIITYAGNIGEGQGMHKIIPPLAQALGEKYRFRIIGDGGKKAELLDQIEKNNLNNVELLPPVSRKNLLEYYSETHFLFMHLNDYEAFEKVLPSKIFEYGATDKPIIAGVSGYAAEFISKNLSNCILFSPRDADNLVQQLQNFHFKYQFRNSFRQKFVRTHMDQKMAQSIINTVNSSEQ